MAAKLENITKIIAPELDEFDNLFKTSLKSKVLLVDLVSKYIIKTKGKRIRPILVLLSAQLCGGINERTYRGAGLVELLHTATLVHDDVVDDAEERRSFPSINAVWKNKIAVLMGDYLLSRGLMLAVDNDDLDFLKSITHSVKRMSEGELLQINKTRKLDIDERTYFSIISDKTASLISTCCEIGAKSATNNSEITNKMKEFGENLGIAFQIKDDILDYVGSSSGKKIGIDLKEKKITLPLLFCMNSAPKKEVDKIKKLINKKKKENFDDIMEFIYKYNGLRYAQDIADNYTNRCKETLMSFDDTPYRKTFIELVDFVVTRKK